MMTVFAWLALLAAADAPPADTWPGFRNRGDGIAAAAGLPMTWSETENIAWNVPLTGYGQSSPVVFGGRVYLTAVDGRQREKGYVLAYDARTGKKLWEHAFEPTLKVEVSPAVARAAPTPTADAAGVYAFFEGGNLLALTPDGKPRWARSLIEDYGNFDSGHGVAASLAQTTDAVIVLVDHGGPSYLLAADKATGKTRWKVDRPGGVTWTSPVLAQRGGRDEILVSGGGSVLGYDPATGTERWAYTGLTGNTVPSASVAGDAVVVGASIRSGRGPGNRGGETAPADPGSAAKSNCCLEPTESGAKVRWSAKSATASFASPLVYRGHVYFVSTVGVVACLDLKTGEERYSERLDAPCWASPIGAGDAVYFFGRDGRTTVLKAGAKFEKLASNRLWDPAAVPPPKQPVGGPMAGLARDPIVYGVAVADGAFFVRTGTALYRIGKP